MTSQVQFSLNASTLNPSEPAAPTTGTYGNLFQPLFGTLSAPEQQAIWADFLQVNSLPNPPPEDTTTQGLFTTYAQEAYTYIENAILAQPGLNINLPLLTPPTTGYFGQVMQSYFSNLSATQQQQIWVQFLSAYNVTTAAPDPGLEQFFGTYAATINNFITSYVNPPSSFTLALMNPPTTGFYGQSFAAYFGGETPIQQRLIWAQFLLQNNFATTMPPETAQDEQLFVTYASNVLGAMQGEQVQSPGEIQKRAIMTATFDTLVLMLNAMQDTVGVQSDNLIYLGNVQQAFTTEMTSVPTYIGQPNNDVQAPATVGPNTDWTKFTFGYNNISVADIANWWAYNSLVPSGSPQTFTMASQGTVKTAGGATVPLFSLTFTPQSGTTPGSISWSYAQPVIGTQGTYSVSITQTGGQTLPALSTFASTAATGGPLQSAITSYADSFESSFATAWNQSSTGIQSLLSTVNSNNLQAINSVTVASLTTGFKIDPRSTTDTGANSALEIPWQYGYVVPSGQHNSANGSITPAGNLSDQQAKSRAEINANLQNFIENLRASRQTVQNQAQNVETNLDQTRQGVTDESDMLDSTLQTMQDIVHAIFQR